MLKLMFTDSCSSGLARCPDCRSFPEVMIEENAGMHNVILSCAEHGHEAQGETLDKAAENWNIYIRLGWKAA